MQTECTPSLFEFEPVEWRKVVVDFRGGTITSNVGANALGDPLNVIEWTANHLSALRHGIKAGEVVSTGTCTGVTPVAPGETLIADFGTLGRVEVRVIAA